MAANLLKKQIALLIVSVSVVSVIISGCGRKAPPMPPGIPDLQAVTDINHTINGDAVTLTWTAPQGEGNDILEGYVVHRSVSPVEDEECPGCPIRFQKVADIKSGTESHTEVLKKGYRYIYKVVAYSEYNTFSRDSKLVKFTYQD